MPLFQSEARTKSPRVGFILLVGLVALIAAGKAILFDTLDPDLFWHLRVAQQLHTDGIRPLVDHLSFSSVQTPWTPYSWLAELAMAWLWDHAGWRSAVFTQAMMQAGFVGLLAWNCVVGGSGAEPASDLPGRLPSALATAWAAFLSLPYLSFRPVTAALVLLALCAVLLVRDRRRVEVTRAIWLIIPITALIVNLHLYAIFVPLWIAALLGGALWEWRAAQSIHRAEAQRRIYRYGYLLTGTALACLATPMLPGVIASSLRYQFQDPMVAGNFIAEMRPFYHGIMGNVSGALVALFMVCAAANRHKLRSGDWCWLAVSTVFLFRLGRFAPVFAITAAPIFAATMPRLSDRILTRTAPVIAMALVLVMGVIRIGKSFPASGRTLSSWLNRHGPDAPGYPCAAADYVAAHITPRSAKILNEFSWGGYVEWKLGDQYQTLLDGRTQLFTPAFWRATYLGSETDRAQFLASVHADAAVVPATGGQFRETLIELGWQKAFNDDRAMVLLPPPSITGGNEEATVRLPRE